MLELILALSADLYSVPGAQENAGVTPEMSRALVAFGYTALVANFAIGLFAVQVNEWLSRKMFELDIENYRERWGAVCMYMLLQA